MNDLSWSFGKKVPARATAFPVGCLHCRRLEADLWFLARLPGLSQKFLLRFWLNPRPGYAR